MILSKEKKQSENQTVGNLVACVCPFKIVSVINSSSVNGQYMDGFHVS